MPSLIKNIITIVTLLVIAAAGYYFFVIQRGNELNTTRSSEATLLTNEFLKRLNELQAINLSGDLFDDPRFTTLTDFSTVPESVSTGRDNPFSL